MYFLFALAVAAAGAVLWGHANHYLPFLSDDALISLRYARRLLQGHGLTWTDGERVEGYSNLLWVLACAGAGALRVDLITAARVLGFMGTGAGLGAIAFAVRGARAERLLAALVGMMLVALADPVACWTIAGLEQGLIAGLLGWGLVLSFPLLHGSVKGSNPAPGGLGATPSGSESFCSDDPGFRCAASGATQIDPLRGSLPGWYKTLLPGLLFGLLALTRPDGILFAAAIALGIIIGCGMRQRAAWMRAVRLGVIAGAFFIAQLVFRLIYYHDWVPNTAYVKLEPSLERLLSGWAYVKGGVAALKWPAGLAALGFIVCLWNRASRRRAVLVGLSLAVWLGYLIIIGGDHFPVYRHFVPAVVCMGLLAALGVERLMEIINPWPLRILPWAACAVVFYGAINEHLLLAGSRRAIEEFWEWDGEIIGNALKRAFAKEQPLLAVDPAGCVPYFSELPAIDMLGLNDRHIARHRAPMEAELARGVVGHDRGDGAYVLGRKPDLVIFNQPLGSEAPCFRSGAELFRLPEFQTLYKLVQFEAEQKVFKIYVRAEDGRLAARRAADRVEVPGWLLTDHPERPLVSLDGEGRPHVEARPEKPAMLKNFALPMGTWRVTADAATLGSVELVVRVGAGGAGDAREMGLPAEFELTDSKSKIDLAIWPKTGTAGITRVTFSRAGASIGDQADAESG